MIMQEIHTSSAFRMYRSICNTNVSHAWKSDNFYKSSLSISFLKIALLKRLQAMLWKEKGILIIVAFYFYDFLQTECVGINPHSSSPTIWSLGYFFLKYVLYHYICILAILGFFQYNFIVYYCADSTLVEKRQHCVSHWLHASRERTREERGGSN